MTLAQKVGFLILHRGNEVENENYPVPSLCLPALTLSDGPDGIGDDEVGVTQFPAAIAIGASFDPGLARLVGAAIGDEAKVKGIDVVEGPELNLARVPQDGRIFESYGEDPFLTSVMGVAAIQGIQSQGVMAMAKHFVAYTQETARSRLNQLVPHRALVELYDVPFEAAVKVGHVASLMCAIGLLNGVHECSDAALYDVLRSWDFHGFVRSDLRAALDVKSAFRAGLDLVRPASFSKVLAYFRRREIPMDDLNRAVRIVLTTMFAHGLIAHPRMINSQAYALTPSHTMIALEAAEEGTVLLKNDGSLPLSRRDTSVAVIGLDASSRPETTGSGSSKVVAPFVVTPLSALRADLGSRSRISFAPGEFESIALHTLDQSFNLNGPGERRHGRSRHYSPVDLSIEEASNVTNNVVTATNPGNGVGWSHWSVHVEPQRTGDYEFALHQIGDTWLTLNGMRLLSSPGLHAPSEVSTTVRLRAGRSYEVAARWFSVIKAQPPALGIADVSSEIARAVRLAARSKVAIVFASNFSSEGADHNGLSLPGDENQLIESVASVNARTIVVLNTGGPVTMPWLSRVSAVLEAWYPGEEDGNAIANVLTGAFDPSGRLPITFPRSLALSPIDSSSQFPGVDATVNYGSISSSLDVGYRWYQARRVKPLFAFGYGLDYTRFRLIDVSTRVVGTWIVVECLVANTGSRTGVDVVQAYVKDPPAAGEPPEQLRAFTRISLRPRMRQIIILTIPFSSLRVSQPRGLVLVSGDYKVGVGESSQDIIATDRVVLS
jgi:beta-glucosidase